jgi:c-di-GMP-binding flagellar brake protein YcgR
VDTSGDEKRAFGRLEKAAFVELTPADVSGGAHLARMEALDISRGGIRLACDVEMPQGSRWKVSLLLAESATLNADWELRHYEPQRKVVSATARVVRSHGAPEIGYEVALQFENLTEDEADEIAHFMREA